MMGPGGPPGGPMMGPRGPMPGPGGPGGPPGMMPMMGPGPMGPGPMGPAMMGGKHFELPYVCVALQLVMTFDILIRSRVMSSIILFLLLNQKSF